MLGDVNDYAGKGLSGGVIAVRPDPDSPRGRRRGRDRRATRRCTARRRGKAFFRGLAGERFAVRNSGADAVVEGCGDHGCEYMTGGHVVVLGPTGRNFAAGMSGGIAYVLDADGDFAARCNQTLVGLDVLDGDDRRRVLRAAARAPRAHRLARRRRGAVDFDAAPLVKVIPHDYRRALERSHELAEAA